VLTALPECAGAGCTEGRQERQSLSLTREGGDPQRRGLSLLSLEPQSFATVLTFAQVNVCLMPNLR
jgi:hypothetical protein